MLRYSLQQFSKHQKIYVSEMKWLFWKTRFSFHYAVTLIYKIKEHVIFLKLSKFRTSESQDTPLFY